MIVSGCGGGDGPLSAARYAHEVSAVCTRTNRAVDRVAMPPLGRRGDATRALARIVEIQRVAIADLRGLRPPDRASGLHQRWIALLDQATDELEQIEHSLSRGHRIEARGFADKATTLLARARQVMSPRGVTTCRGPELPAA